MKRPEQAASSCKAIPQARVAGSCANELMTSQRHSIIQEWRIWQIKLQTIMTPQRLESHPTNGYACNFTQASSWRLTNSAVAYTCSGSESSVEFLVNHLGTHTTCSDDSGR